jgi:hypothetical protein
VRRPVKGFPCRMCSQVNSVVTAGPVSSHLMTVQRFADDFYELDHVHDMNTKARLFECSAGHRWIIRWKMACWCGWGANEPPVGEAYEQLAEDE